MSLFSTIKRENEHFKMFLVANTVCRVNPFVRAWGLSNFNKQKPGTIDRYKLYLGIFDENNNEKYMTIAREYSGLTADGKSNSENQLNDNEGRVGREANISNREKAIH